VSQLRESIESIQKSSDDIVEIVRKLSGETIQWKPSLNAWSILEILCHVEEAVPYWADEIHRVVENPGAEWGRGHQNEARLAAVAASTQREARDVLAGIEKGTQRAVTVLRTLRNEDLAIESPSRNPRLGAKPMSFALDHLLVAHLRDHLRQIERNIGQFVAASSAAPQN
jgi:uncharacterized damage-inducible protein DinB